MSRRRWRARSLLVRHRYALAHAHFIFPDGLLAWRIHRTTRLPYVITAHGSDVPGYNPHRLRLAHWLLAPLWRTVAGHAAQIVCPSRTLASLVRRQRLAAPVRLIPNGIDAEAVHPTAYGRWRDAAPRAEPESAVGFL